MDRPLPVCDTDGQSTRQGSLLDAKETRRLELSTGRALDLPGVEVRLENYEERQPVTKFSGIVSIEVFEHFTPPQPVGDRKGRDPSSVLRTMSRLAVPRFAPFSATSPMVAASS